MQSCKLGKLITQRREKSDGTPLPICGVSRSGLIPPKQQDADTSIYNVFYRNDFIFNPARMELNAIAFNDKYEKAMCSSLYEVFYVSREDLIIPEYLKLIVKQDWFTRYCNFLGQGSAREYCRFANISEIIIEFPDLETQKTIVNQYNIISKRIELKQQINENLEVQLSTLFRSQFTPLNFDTISDKTLSELMRFGNGYAFSSEDYLPYGKYKIVTIGNVGDGFLDTSKVNYLDAVSDNVKESYLLSVGDIVLSLTGNVGRTAIVKEENLLLNQRVARIIPTDDKYYGFLYCLFRDNLTKSYLEGISKGTAQLNLSPIELLKTNIDYDFKEIITFSKIAKPIIFEIINNSIEISELTELANEYLTILSR